MILTTGAMVFTVRVRTRRAVLTALPALGLSVVGPAGCGIGAQTEIVWHPGPDPLLPFLTSTTGLAALYDAAIVAVPGLAGQLDPLRASHRAHIVALRRELGLAETPSAPGTAAGTPVPADQAGVLATLRTAENKGLSDATAFCLSAPSYRAGLLGSIAACRAAHVAALG